MLFTTKVGGINPEVTHRDLTSYVSQEGEIDLSCFFQDWPLLNLQIQEPRSPWVLRMDQSDDSFKLQNTHTRLCNCTSFQLSQLALFSYRLQCAATCY